MSDDNYRRYDVPVIVEAEQQPDANGAGYSQHVVVELKGWLMEDANWVLNRHRAYAVLAVVEGEDAHYLQR